MNGISTEQQTVLEDAVEADPGAAGFPALGEAYRRAGRLDEAARVLRQGLERKADDPAGRLVLASVLIDQGRVAEARDELEPLTEAVLASHGIVFEPELAASGASVEAALSESELDDAFEQAETDTDELITPNRVAEAAVAHVDAGAGDGIDEGARVEGSAGDGVAPGVLGTAIEPGSAFATATMAELLARQGDESGAERIRAALGPVTEAPTEEASEDVAAHQVVGTLERWLQNIRGDRP